MKIAVFGGSFNPVHFGHLNAAEEILSSGLVQELWLVPCYSHAFKPEKALAPFDDRLEMAKIAVQGKEKMKAVGVEKQFKTKYTIDLLKKLKKIFPKHEFFFVIGSDLVKEFTEWKNPGGIVKLAKLVVVESPLAEIRENEFINKKNCFFLKPKRTVGVSAKTIRHNTAKGKSVSGMLPEKVINYIEQKGLYGKKT